MARLRPFWATCLYVYNVIGPSERVGVASGSFCMCFAENGASSIAGKSPSALMPPQILMNFYLLRVLLTPRISQFGVVDPRIQIFLEALNPALRAIDARFDLVVTHSSILVMGNRVFVEVIHMLFRAGKAGQYQQEDRGGHLGVRAVEKITSNKRQLRGRGRVRRQSNF